jgi:hypothetical protein
VEYLNCHSPIKKPLTYLLGMVFLLNALFVSAQVNAFVGYVNAYNRNEKTVNDIIGRYNARHPTLLQPMTGLHSLNGVDLGLRYRFSGVGFEFNWVNKFAQFKDRVLATDNTEYRNILYYKSQTFCLGTEFFYEWFGIGASIDWNKIVVKREKSTDRIKVAWMDQHGFSNHIFMNFEINMNDAMAVSIRPFIQLPLYKNDFFPLEAKLNPEIASTFDPETYKQKTINWGIKFLFVNGTKSR